MALSQLEVREETQKRDESPRCLGRALGGSSALVHGSPGVHRHSEDESQEESLPCLEESEEEGERGKNWRRREREKRTRAKARHSLGEGGVKECGSRKHNIYNTSYLGVSDYRTPNIGTHHNLPAACEDDPILCILSGAATMSPEDRCGTEEASLRTSLRSSSITTPQWSRPRTPSQH